MDPTWAMVRSFAENENENVSSGRNVTRSWKNFSREYIARYFACGTRHIEADVGFERVLGHHHFAMPLFPH